MKVQENDLIYIQHEHNKVTFLIRYQIGYKLSTHRGEIVLNEDLSYGDTLTSTKDERFFILYPNIADKMMKVSRSTTPIYPKDAGALILDLNIFPGKRVLEIGSGSGGFTILASHLLGKEGILYSFERKEEHQKTAIKNYEKFKTFDNVKFILADPVEEGCFPLPNESIDSMLIDVPEPWLIVDVIKDILVPGGFIASISPQIEQIQKTIKALRQNGYTRILAKEILERGWHLEKERSRPYDRMIGHTVFLLTAQKRN